MKNVFFGTYIRTIVTFYAGFTLIGALLLMLPFSTPPDQALSFVDAIFISASGTSVTGLSSVDVPTKFTLVGKIFLAIIMQFGGIGLMVFLSGAWMIFRKRISFRQRLLVVTDQNQLKFGGVIRLVKDLLILIFTIETIGFLLLSSHFYINGYYSFSESIFQAFFLTISLFANAGFEISDKSITYFAEQKDYFILTVSMCLIFLGSVGYWVLVETKNYIRAKINGRKFKFSLFVKLILKMHLLLYLIGAILFIIFESKNFLHGKPFIDYIYHGLFMSITTRNAGFSTMNVALTSESTQLAFTALMFIGASPNSVGGGIRTSTLLILIYSIYSFAIGRKQVVIKKRSIKEGTVYKSFIVFTTGIIIIFVSTLLISGFEKTMGLNKIMFEVFSAFGTTGLSLGITDSLSTMSKIIIIIDMFIGRIGIISLLLVIKNKGNVRNRVKYPQFDMIIGA